VLDDPYELGRLDDHNGLRESDNLDRLSRVDLKDTSFKKFNLNFFYKKWILDFKLDPNI